MPGTCAYALTQDYFASSAKLATAAVAFDPATEVVPPTITVEPADGLADGDSMTVTGSGFRPGGWVDASLCAGDVDPGNCIWLNAFSGVDDAGDVQLTARLFAVFNRPAGGQVDCREPGATCSIVLASGNVGSPRAGHAALAFDPDAPLLPAPTVEVSRSSDLPDDATVTVTGANFSPGGFAAVEQCAVDDDFLCDRYTSTDVDIDGSGGFTVDVPVTSVISPWEGDPVDCRARGCQLVARDYTRHRSVTVPLSFAPEAPPVRYSTRCSTR